jgi:hypothetical protein
MWGFHRSEYLHCALVSYVTTAWENSAQYWEWMESHYIKLNNCIFNKNNDKNI